MHLAKRFAEFSDHVPERQLQCRPATNQNVIVAAAQRIGVRESYQFAQPPPDAVALYRIADLPRHREADPHGIFIGTPPGLQYESLARRPHSSGGSAKIRSALQPIHVEQRLNGKLAPVTH